VSRGLKARSLRSIISTMPNPLTAATWRRVCAWFNGRNERDLMNALESLRAAIAALAASVDRAVDVILAGGGVPAIDVLAAANDVATQTARIDAALAGSLPAPELASGARPNK